jgi:hypothetical protein
VHIDILCLVNSVKNTKDQTFNQVILHNVKLSLSFHNFPLLLHICFSFLDICDSVSQTNNHLIL